MADCRWSCSPGGLRESLDAARNGGPRGPRLSAKRPLRSIEPHVILGPGNEATRVAAGLRLARLQPRRWIVFLVEVAFIDHPSDHAAQRRKKVARLRRSARLHFFLDSLTRQHAEWLLAILPSFDPG